MGLDIVLGWDGQSAEEREKLLDFSDDSRPGYLRSSYNEGGFERWADTFLEGFGWEWIFQYDPNQLIRRGDQDTFCPDWDASMNRASQALELAKNLGGNRFVVAMPRPHGEPSEFPESGKVLEAFELARKSQEQFYGSSLPDVPLKEPNLGRFATKRVRILGVFWGQCITFNSSREPELDIQPNLICEGDDNVHLAYIEMLEATVRFIAFGKEKSGWLHWSG